MIETMIETQTDLDDRLSEFATAQTLRHLGDVVDTIDRVNETLLRIETLLVRQAPTQHH